MIGLQDVRAVCAGRSIAVVGNSAALLARGDGAAIEACDLVLRMNHGLPRPAFAHAVGRRTDLWACSYNAVAMQPRELALFDPRLVLHLPADKRHIHAALLPRAHLDAPENARRLAEAMGAWPSTGALAIHFLLDTVGGCGPLHLFGFDHFARPNFHAPHRRANCDRHDPEAERRYVAGLAAQGRIVPHA